jgi:quinol monooxygenase YgiN
MAEKKVTVVATFKAKAGMEAATKEAVLALVAPTRSEAGCINYDLHQSAEDPSVLMLYENWISKKDLDEHLAMPYLKDFLEKADDLLREPVDIAIWQMISDPAS